jgi:hypothetical protein
MILIINRSVFINERDCVLREVGLKFYIFCILLDDMSLLRHFTASINALFFLFFCCCYNNKVMLFSHINPPQCDRTDNFPSPLFSRFYPVRPADTSCCQRTCVLLVCFSFRPEFQQLWRRNSTLRWIISTMRSTISRTVAGNTWANQAGHERTQEPK